MFNYDPTKISKYWPQVAKIEIKAKQTYVSAFGKFEQELTSSHLPDFAANFMFRCINKDCTMEYFDLYSAVSMAIAQHKDHAAGTLECLGKEAEDHPLNMCPCKLDYEIKIEYM